LQVVLFDRSLLAAYRTGGAMALRERFHHDAQTTMRIKREQVDETLEDLANDES
jgi:hypothetical protein